MKKIILTSLVMLAVGGISYGQTTAKTTVKKETLKPASSVSSVTPTVTRSKTETKTSAPATTAKVPATAIRKHKRVQKTAKKAK